MIMDRARSLSTGLNHRTDTDERKLPARILQFFGDRIETIPAIVRPQTRVESQSDIERFVRCA
jgi:hypothetical protein